MATTPATQIAGAALPPQTRTGQAKATQPVYLTEKPKLNEVGRYHIALMRAILANAETKANRAKEARNVKP